MEDRPARPQEGGAATSAADGRRRGAGSGQRGSVGGFDCSGHSACTPRPLCLQCVGGASRSGAEARLEQVGVSVEVVRRLDVAACWPLTAPAASVPLDAVAVVAALHEE